MYDIFISYNSADKAIADMLCHYIEHEGLRCFIAPRDIEPPDWAASITKAIESARAFVVVISENSIASNEVAKEITLATRKIDFIFPFRVDSAELDGRLEYHLAPFHWIDAVSPPLEAKINDLIARIRCCLEGNGTSEAENESRNTKTMKYRILSENVAPRAEFLGREEEIEEISLAFREHQNAVFLTGMGGIGKSEIARAYAREHAAEYDIIVFLRFEESLLQSIADDTKLPVENMARSASAGGEAESPEAYFARKMNCIKSLANERTLLIIDNFDVEWDEQLAEVTKLPCRIIFTTRTDFSDMGFRKIGVGPIEETNKLVHLMASIDKAYSGEEAVAVEQIIELLQRHTYAISLTAAQMKAGHIKPSKMLAELREHGLDIHAKSGFVRGPEGVKATAYQYIEALFDFSDFSDTETQILRDLYICPPEGVDIDLFMEYAEIEDFEDISRLIQRNWVMNDEENDKINLHMLVREMVKKKLSPCAETCRTLLTNAGMSVANAWNMPLEYNREREPLIYAILRSVTDFTYEDQEAVDGMGTFCWIMGNYELSETTELRLFEVVREHCGEISREAGNQALRVAATYHNWGRYAEARPWYERGMKISLEADPVCYESIMAMAKVSRSCCQLGDYETAASLVQKSREAIDKHLNGNTDTMTPFRLNFVDTVNKLNASHLLVLEGKSAEAEKPAREALYQWTLPDVSEPANRCYAQINLARVLMALGKYDEAVSLAEEALESSIRDHGEGWLDVFSFSEICGDIEAAAERFGDAQKHYSQALETLEKYYNGSKSEIARLTGKLESVCSGCTPEEGVFEYWI